VKHRISQEWDCYFDGACPTEKGKRNIFALLVASNSVRPKREQTQRVRVAVAREVPSGRNFIRDDDNLRFCVKPLLDALKRLGFIRNDSRKWIELPTPEQRISTDGHYWTEVILSTIDERADASE